MVAGVELKFAMDKIQLYQVKITIFIVVAATRIILKK